MLEFLHMIVTHKREMISLEASEMGRSAGDSRLAGENGLAEEEG